MANKLCLMFEYNNIIFMDLNKIIVFKNNLKKIEEKGMLIRIIFYGDAQNEEFVSFMSLFNKLVGQKICDISISFKTKELVIENGISNKFIKIPYIDSKKIKDKNFKKLINDFYQEETEIRVLQNTNWESIILKL